MVQCPNCGGYRVETETITVNRKTNKPFDFGCTFWFILIFAGIMPTLLGAIGWIAFLFGKPPSYRDTNSQSTLLCALPAGLFFLIPTLLSIKSYFGADTFDVCHNTCGYCNYTWTWKTGEPLPHVTLRPDLIEKGEQRLRDEYEARRARFMAEEAMRRAGMRK